MTVYEFLETTTIAGMRQSVDFTRTMELLKRSSYIEILFLNRTNSDWTQQSPTINLIVLSLIQNDLYLCSDYTDYQKFIIIVCCSLQECANTYLITITERYIKEKRIEELRFLSFILYVLSDYIHLSPLVSLIDKSLFRFRMDAYKKKQQDTLYSLNKNIKSMHQYNFIDLIFKYNNETKTVKELASLCGYSLSSFKTQFKNYFQISPYQWKLQQKKEQILGLIKHSTFSLLEISELCKFSAYSNFSTFCRTHLNDTPRNLMIRLRN